MSQLERLDREDVPSGQLSLTGPSIGADEGHLPVRGDLAHIALAGRYFVPHYAVPMPHIAGPAGAVVRMAPQADAEELLTLAAGDVFAVLDIAGGWTWGQVGGPTGTVGYVASAELEPVTT